MKKFQTEREMQKDYLLKDGDYKTTKDVFERIARLIPNAKILAELDENQNIVYHNSTEILSDIENIGDGLLSLGLAGKHIVISATNSYKYVICDMAIAGGVGIVTPIDVDATDDLFTTLLNKCDAEAIICSSFLLEKVNTVKKDCKKLKTIITIDHKVEGYEFYDEILEKGKNLKNKLYKSQKLDLDSPVKILFTSGTTGANKGVMLTQRNLAANIINCLESVKGPKNETNTSMSILPMHHATEINTHIMPRIAAGRLTYINDKMRNMMTNIKIFKPHIITIVPMIANAFYKTIWANAKKVGKDKKLKKGIKLCKLINLFGKDITHKLFAEVYEPFGGNLNQIVCGGAPLNPEVVKGMRDLGIYMINGFGITECGPLVSMNADTIKEVYSIGKACPNLEVKLVDVDENGVGELCIKGPSVAKGYYNDEEATKQVFTNDGFFHTGDLVRIDKQGRMFLSGRKKNLIILPNGKNVSPEEIEKEIENNIPYIKEVVVYSASCKTKEGTKDLICAGMFIEDEALRQNIEQIKSDITLVNKKLTNYMQINFIDLATSEYEKTATKKIKRDLAFKKHNEKTGIAI